MHQPTNAHAPVHAGLRAALYTRRRISAKQQIIFLLDAGRIQRLLRSSPVAQRHAARPTQGLAVRSRCIVIHCVHAQSILHAVECGCITILQVVTDGLTRSESICACSIPRREGCAAAGQQDLMDNVSRTRRHYGECGSVLVKEGLLEGGATMRI